MMVYGVLYCVIVFCLKKDIYSCKINSFAKLGKIESPKMQKINLR